MLPLNAPHSLDIHSDRATHVGALSAAEVGLLLIASHGVGRLDWSAFDVAGLPLGALDHQWFERHWLPAWALEHVDTLAH